MNTDKAETLLPNRPEATPVQAGSFSLGSAFLRVLPTLGWLPFNFTPVGGLAVFSGARVRSWLAYVLPLALMVVTDLVLWGITGQDTYSPLHVSQPVVYACFLVYVLLGRWFGGTLLGIGFAGVLGSVQFFLVTNFAYWLQIGSPGGMEGLLLCYEAGIPFYQFTFLSDLCFPFLFLGLHYLWVKASQPVAQEEVSLS